MRIQIRSGVGFSDGEVYSYERIASDLIVRVRAWNDTNLTVIFARCEGLCDLGVGDISDLVEETQPNQFFERVISRVYENAPENNPYHLYHFLDVDGEPSMDVIAQSARVDVTPE